MQEKYDKRLSEYEQRRIEHGGKVPKVTGHQTVVVRNTSVVETKRLLGYLWPTAYWSAQHDNEKPPRSRLQSVMHQGKNIVGVMMSHLGPDPTRAIEMNTIAQTGIDRCGELASTEESSLAQVEDVHARAVKRTRLSSSVNSHGTFRVTAPSGASPRQAVNDIDDEDDEDALIDSVMGRLCVTSRPGGNGDGKVDDAETEQTKKRPKTEKPKLKPPDGPPPPQHLKSKRWTQAAFTKALDETEQVNLKCKQMLSGFADAKVMLTTTLKSFDGLVASLSKRLSPHLVDMYSSEYVTGVGLTDEKALADSRAMILFSEAREHEMKLSKCRPLIACVQASEGEDATAAALFLEYERVVAEGLVVTGFVQSMCNARAIKQCGDEDCTGILKILDYEEVGTEFGIHTLSEGDAKTAQKQHIVE